MLHEGEKVRDTWENRKCKKNGIYKAMSIFNLSVTMDNTALVLNMPEKQVEKLVVFLVSYLIF